MVLSLYDMVIMLLFYIFSVKSYQGDIDWHYSKIRAPASWSWCWSSSRNQD